MKVKKVSPSSGLKRNLLLAAVAWAGARLGSDSRDGARKPAGRTPARSATAKDRKAGRRATTAAKGDKARTATASDRKASDKKLAAAEKAERKARAKISARPPKIVAKQSKKAAKLTKKSRAGRPA